MKPCLFCVNLGFINKSNKSIHISSLITSLNISLRSTSSDTKKDELTSFKNPPKKKKITVIRRSFNADPNKSKVLEWKDAAAAVRKFNWENKHLYGPIQSTKVDPCSEDKIYESNLIIQHQTQFPVVEPSINVNYNLNVKSINNKNKRKEQFDLNSILDFPLINKTNNENNIPHRVNEMNCVRKYLESKCGSTVPSVSAILDKTMPTESVEALARWKQNMIEKLGLDGFEKYRKELLRKGSSLHASINSYLAATPEADILIEENNIGHWKSLKSIFPNVSNVKLLEERVSHPFLCYRGIVDCFAKYRDHLVVIDWKTSKKTKLSLNSTFDNPLQVAAYVGALNFDPKFQYLANKGVIVVAYENGNPATVHFIEETKMQQYWKEWLKRIKLYWEL